MSLLECTSFNYDVVNKICEFIAEQNQPISLTSVQNWEFYRVTKTVTQKGNAYNYVYFYHRSTMRGVLSVGGRKRMT